MLPRNQTSSNFRRNWPAIRNPSPWIFGFRVSTPFPTGSRLNPCLRPMCPRNLLKKAVIPTEVEESVCVPAPFRTDSSTSPRKNLFLKPNVFDSTSVGMTVLLKKSLFQQAPRYSHRQQGSALILVLWCLLVLGMTVFGVVDMAELSVEHTAHDELLLEARTLASSGLALGLNPQLLKDDPLLSQTPAPGRQFKVTIQSEGARLNLNY